MESAKSPRVALSGFVILVLASVGFFWTLLHGYDPTSGIKDPELQKAAKHFRPLNLVIYRRKALARKVVKDTLEDIDNAVQNEEWGEAHKQIEFARAIAQGGPIRVIVPDGNRRYAPLETDEQYAEYRAAVIEKRRFWNEQESLHGGTWATYADCLSDPLYQQCDRYKKLLDDESKKK